MKPIQKLGEATAGEEYIPSPEEDRLPSVTLDTPGHSQFIEIYGSYLEEVREMRDIILDLLSKTKTHLITNPLPPSGTKVMYKGVRHRIHEVRTYDNSHLEIFVWTGKYTVEDPSLIPIPLPASRVALSKVTDQILIPYRISATKLWYNGKPLQEKVTYQEYIESCTKT